MKATQTLHNLVVCPSFSYLFEGDAAAGDLVEDGFGGGGPDEGFGVVVVGVEVFLDGGDEVGHGMKYPARSALSVSSRNQRSTRLSHDEEVGVKWRWNRGCLASQFRTSGCLWVA